MIRFLKRLLFGPDIEFEVGQVVLLTKPYSYLGYLPVKFEMIPEYWRVVEILSEDHGRIRVCISPIFDAHKRTLVKRGYFPEVIHVEPGHIEPASDFIQILYGGKNGH